MVPGPACLQASTGNNPDPVFSSYNGPVTNAKYNTGFLFYNIYIDLFL